MTIQQAIERADELRPNTLSDAMKKLWLAQLDGILRCQVVALHAPESALGRGADAAQQNETVLLAPEPDTGLYLYWLMAQTDLALGELARYANDMQLYNSALAEFAARYKATHRPLAQGRFRM